MSTTTITNLIHQTSSDLGILIFIGVSTVLALASYLVVLGWAWANLKTTIDPHGEFTPKNDLDTKNRLFADQIHNSELLARGDKTATLEELSQ